MLVNKNCKYYSIINNYRPYSELVCKSAFFASHTTIFVDESFSKQLCDAFENYLECCKMNFVPNQLYVPEDYYKINAIDTDLFDSECLRYFFSVIVEFKKRILKQVWTMAFNYYNPHHPYGDKIYIDSNNNHYIDAYCTGFYFSVIKTDRAYIDYDKMKNVRINIPNGVITSNGIILHNDPVKKYFDYLFYLFSANGLFLEYIDDYLDSFHIVPGCKIKVYIPIIRY